MVDLRVVNNRIVSHYMEPRAAVAEYDTASESYVLHAPSQGVHSLRDILAKDIFRIGRDKVRVITGDVGGGFGTKSFCYREYALVMEAARGLAGRSGGCRAAPNTRWPTPMAATASWMPRSPSMRSTA